MVVLAELVVLVLLPELELDELLPLFDDELPELEELLPELDDELSELTLAPELPESLFLFDEELLDELLPDRPLELLPKPEPLSSDELSELAAAFVVSSPAVFSLRIISSSWSPSPPVISE